MQIWLIFCGNLKQFYTFYYTFYCAKIPLTHNCPFCILNPPQSEFLVRQAKSGESSWLRSQPDKVSRPSEPSFASMQVTVWVKRKQGDSRP